MKKTSFSIAFIFLFCLIIPCFAFVGCSLTREKAICKIGNTKYNSLAEALVECKEGDTISIYNDVNSALDQDFLNKNNFVTADANGNHYISYTINKAINIVGVKQKRKKPKIYGSFITNLSNLAQINSSVNISNLEIINDYISLEDDNLNKPFNTAVDIQSGSASIKDCDIHPYQNISNAHLTENNITCLNGITISRLDNQFFNNQLLTYEIEDNNIYNYTNWTQTSYSSAISLLENQDGYGTLAPYNYNEFFIDNLLKNNKISTNNSTILQFFDYSTQIYKYLQTSNSNLICQENFAKDSIVKFEGTYFGYNEKQTFDVYGQMSFVNVTNVHFVIKTSSGNVKISGNRKNVDVDVFMPIP